MPLALGKIVKSNAHTDYVCQVYGPKEIDNPPQVEDYAFGTFVAIEVREFGQLVGLVYDTVLLNPEFGKLGPRLSPLQQSEYFTPDFLNERAILLGITAMGYIDAAGRVSQRVPRLSATTDAEVYKMAAADIRKFHNGAGDTLNLTYLPMLLHQHADNPLIFHMARVVLDELQTLLPEHRTTLDVLANDLLWRTQINPMGGFTR